MKRKKKLKKKRKEESSEISDFLDEGGSNIEERKNYKSEKGINASNHGNDRAKNENKKEEKIPLAESKDQVQKQVNHRDEDKNEKAYNPTYSVFNTEGRFIKDGAEMYHIDPFLVDEYYINNIRENDTQMREHRTKRLVPPRQINLTEEDEKRMKAVGKQIELDKTNERNMQIQGKMEDLQNQIKQIDTKKMSKMEIEHLREKERVAYFRENMRNKMEAIDVRAIEFDWLFSKEGARFLTHISKSESIELFSLEIIRVIIKFFWDFYVVRILIASLIPFLFYFVVFITYVSYISDEDNLKDDVDPNWNMISDIFKYVIAFLAAYHLFLEFLYFRRNGRKYFKSFWNIVNLFTIGLTVATIVIDFLNLDYSVYFVPVASSAVIMMWLKLFYFGRIINATATIVRMIIEISNDMGPFLIIVFIFLTGFANSFYIIAQINGGGERFTSDNFALAIMWTWNNGTGNFDTDGFDELTGNISYLVYCIWLLCTFMILIVFLNLLIAVLSDSFDKIQETLQNNLYKEMAIMMSENEVFINRKSVFKGVKYLFIIRKVQVAEGNDKWGGRLDYVNKIVKKTQDIHFKRMDNIVE